MTRTSLIFVVLCIIIAGCSNAVHDSKGTSAEFNVSISPDVFTALDSNVRVRVFIALRDENSTLFSNSSDPQQREAYLNADTDAITSEVRSIQERFGDSMSESNIEILSNSTYRPAVSAYVTNQSLKLLQHNPYIDSVRIEGVVKGSSEKSKVDEKVYQKIEQEQFVIVEIGIQENPELSTEPLEGESLKSSPRYMDRIAKQALVGRILNASGARIIYESVYGGGLIANMTANQLAEISNLDYIRDISLPVGGGVTLTESTEPLSDNITSTNSQSHFLDIYFNFTKYDECIKDKTNRLKEERAPNDIILQFDNEASADDIEEMLNFYNLTRKFLKIRNPYTYRMKVIGDEAPFRAYVLSHSGVMDFRQWADNLHFVKFDDNVSKHEAQKLLYSVPNVTIEELLLIESKWGVIKVPEESMLMWMCELEQNSLVTSANVNHIMHAAGS